MTLAINIRMLSIAAIAFSGGMAYAQNYPAKPIRIITAAAGGGADFTSRQIAQGISGPLGQPVVVDNRVGVVAAEAVSKSPPDGYTLLVTGSTLWVFPILNKAPYDIADIAPISLISTEPLVVAIHPSIPAKSIKELIAIAKARPGELNYAFGGLGGPSHLSGQLFKSMAGVNIQGVPYKGNAAAIAGLVGGEVHIAIYDAGLVIPLAKSGRLRALAVTTATPSALTPGIPTVAASGLPGYEWVGMNGIFAPGKTPAAIINRLNQEVVRVLNQPDVKERFLNAQAEIIATSPEQFAALIKSDIAKLGKVIKDAGIKVD